MTAKTAADVAPGRLPFRTFLERFVRVPDERTRRLAPLTLHPEEDRFVSAIDERDPATGLRRYLTFVKSWFKKSGKSTIDGALAVWGLVGDDLAGADREVIVIASDLEQSRDVVFRTACRIVQRDAWLRSKCKVGATEITYRETVRDPDTGGRYEQLHTLRAVPQDVRGLHGSSASMTIFDECWVHDTWDAIESLAPSPARRSPIVAFTSYAGLRSQQRTGVPWFDLVARGRAGTDSALFFSHLGGPDAWRQVPWVTERWIAQMRRLYETVPSKFIRLVENRPAPSDSAFLTLEEVQDAIDRALVEPARGEPGVQYVAALDVGLTHDASALVVGHVAADSKFAVDVCRLWQGSRAQPVSLTEVEAQIVALARRFNLRRLVIDQWQAAQLAEQLQTRGVPAVLVTIEPVKLDKLATLMKGVFTRREIRIPATMHDLIEQAESLDVRETGARNRRRDLLRFDSGTGPGVASHDDAAIALALCLEIASGEIGRPTMDPIDTCYAVDHGMQAYMYSLASACPLISGRGSALPGCKRCSAWMSVWRACDKHRAETGEVIAFTTMVNRMRPCKYVADLKWQGAEAVMW